MPTSPSMPANTSHSRVECPTVQRVPRDWVIAASCGNHRAGSVSQAGATPPTVLDPLQHRIDPGVGDVAPTCGASIERLSRAQADHPAATRSRLVIARSEEHTSEIQSLIRKSYAVFCLKKQKTIITI